MNNVSQVYLDADQLPHVPGAVQDGRKGLVIDGNVIQHSTTNIIVGILAQVEAVS